MAHKNNYQKKRAGNKHFVGIVTHVAGEGAGEWIRMDSEHSIGSVGDMA